MNSSRFVVSAGVLAASLIISASPILAAEGKITPAEKHELRQDRKQIADDKAEIRQDVLRNSRATNGSCARIVKNFAATQKSR